MLSPAHRDAADAPATPRERPHDTPATWVDRAAAPCIHLALLLQRTRDSDPAAADITLQAAVTALARLHPGDETRDLGLQPNHLAAIRLALAAFLDESAAHQPGAERWRDQLFQRQGLPRSANVGHEFFEHLGPLLAIADPTPADLAVLQVHALCLLLGFRGRYGALVDAAETEIPQLLRRLQLRLRPCLAPRPTPPFGHVPRDMPPRPARTSLKFAALLLLAALALAAALHTRRGDHHKVLHTHLESLAAPP